MQRLKKEILHKKNVAETIKHTGRLNYCTFFVSNSLLHFLSTGRLDFTVQFSLKVNYVKVNKSSRLKIITNFFFFRSRLSQNIPGRGNAILLAGRKFSVL